MLLTAGHLLVAVLFAKPLFGQESVPSKENGLGTATWRCNFFRDNQSWRAVAKEGSTFTDNHFCQLWLQRCPEAVTRMIAEAEAGQSPALANSMSLGENSTEMITTTVTIVPVAATMRLPETYTVLTKPLTVEIRLLRGSCIERTLLASVTNVSLQLLRQSEGQSHFSPSDPFSTVHSIRVDVAEDASHSVTFDCDLFDREALYHVQLSAAVSSAEPSDRAMVIASSNAMNATWSPLYELKMRNDRIFPCPVAGIAVSFTKPSCATDRHRIRLYAVVPKKHYAVHIVPETTYIAERKIYQDQAVVHFDCDDFDLIYPKYCFKYVTALVDGTVDEHSTQCVLTERKKCKLASFQVLNS